MMDLILALVIVLPIVYFVMMIAHYMVLKLIVFMKWDETDWFHDMIEEESKQMDKKFLKQVVLPIVIILWLIGVAYLGWKTVLWTCIGFAIGGIVKQLKENVQYDCIRDYKSNKKCKGFLSE